MAIHHNLNFGLWLDRLGLKRPDSPELIAAIQPTMLVSDGSDLVSKLFAPSGIFGAQIPVEALEFGLFKIRARRPTRIVFTSNPGVIVRCGAGAGAPFGANQDPAEIFPFDPTQTAFNFLAEAGTTLTAPTALQPFTSAFQAVPISMWAPQGGFFEMSTLAINTALTIACIFHETPPLPAP